MKIQRSHTSNFLTLSGVLLLIASLVFLEGHAYASAEYTEEVTEDSISLSINKSSTTTSTRQRVIPPGSSRGAKDVSRRSRDSGNIPASVTRSGVASEASSSPRCGNRSERLAAMIENRECDTSIEPEVVSNPRAQQPVPVSDSQPEVVSDPVEIVITASDLLELIPASPEILMDRGPFGLKNAHTNFYASNHRPQTVTRTMFGQEITITATPIEYRWDYGDGHTLVTELPGHPEEVFNIETETSHQYADTGLYTVELTTVFEGTYQVDGGEMQAVSSTVTQQAEPVEIRIWRAVTRNVDQTCAQNPNAWGC